MHFHSMANSSVCSMVQANLDQGDNDDLETSKHEVEVSLIKEMPQADDDVVETVAKDTMGSRRTS